MQLLRNFDIANEYYDLKTRMVVRFESTPKISGWYKMINNDLSGILVQQNKIVVVWKGVVYDVENCHMLISASNDADKRVLSLNMGNRTLFSFVYKVDVSYADTPPFDYLDEDDADWGAYMSAIINDDLRRKNFINNLKNES